MRGYHLESIRPGHQEIVLGQIVAIVHQAGQAFYAFETAAFDRTAFAIYGQFEQAGEHLIVRIGDLEFAGQT